MNIGEKLFELRKNKNLSQEEVAEKLNVTRQTVSKWETNQSTPDFDKIIPLCELFEISTDELLRGKKSESRAEENDTNTLEKQEDNTELKDDTKTEENIKSENIMTKEEKEKKVQNEILKSIKCIIWCLITALYIVLSFVTIAWHITWVIFIIGAVIIEIAKLCFLLKESENDEK